MTQHGRELAETLHKAMDKVYAEKGMTRHQPEPFDELYPWVQDAYLAGVAAITAELAGKAVPKSTDIALFVSEILNGSADQPLVASMQIAQYITMDVLATLQAQLETAREENERLRSATERLLWNFEKLLAGKPVKEADEAIGEARAALSTTDALRPSGNMEKPTL